MKSIRSIEVLKPVLTERFALKVIFDSGEVKKYVLPLSSENKEFCEDEIISFASFDFSNEIWASVEIYTL